MRDMSNAEGWVMTIVIFLLLILVMGILEATNVLDLGSCPGGGEEINGICHYPDKSPSR